MSLLRSRGDKVSGNSSVVEMDKKLSSSSGDGVPIWEEDFMNKRQRDYFRCKLEKWRSDILRQSRETIHQLQSEELNSPDLTDRASTESDWSLELRTRDRQRKLIVKIESALSRLDDGTYGYCEETGEPIGFRRLDARPIATLSVEAQERHERREKIYRDES